ncbi:MAG TPA: branched-chain amino acid ABC transporter permease [Candidatus Acidoferrales bacterium]|nr:branched-chain amino acid ABC transporter permease [Candidatus Acidoferrales bacterium]
MKRSHLILALVAFVLSLLVPVFVHTDYLLQVLFRIYLFAALGLAWNLVGGYAGQLSLGHAAYFGAGAYGLALFTKAGLSPWLAVVLGVIVALAFAALIGAVSFRLRGPYFVLSTIAFAEVLRLLAKNLVRLTGGDVGVQVPSLFAGAVHRWFYWAAVALAAVCFAITILVSRSRFGYYLMAIREDQDTAMAVGVNPAASKLKVLLISAALTALAGALYGSLFLYVVPDQVLSLDVSNEIAIVAMLGGAGTLLGPLAGSAVLETASELFKNIFEEAHLLIYGVLLVVVVLFLPEGIVGTIGAILRRRKVLPPGLKSPAKELPSNP